MIFKQNLKTAASEAAAATTTHSSHKELKLEAFDGIIFIFMVVILQCTIWRGKRVHVLKCNVENVKR